jgi:hypothetical protein
MSNRFIFSSESVGEGHPDKVADTISDAVLDACLAQDKFSRVACETYVKSNIAVVGGEITTKAKLDYVQLTRQAIREIGYVNDDDVFHADKVMVNVYVTQQSPDIAQGVDAKAAEALSPEAVESALTQAAIPDLFGANFNSPTQVVISGTATALAAGTESLKAAGARRVISLCRFWLMVVPGLLGGAGWEVASRAGAAPAVPDRPNIFLIVSDDQHWGDFAFILNG